MNKRIGSGLLGVVMAALACTFSLSTPAPPSPADEVGTVVATTLQALTAPPGGEAASPTPTQTGGTPVAFESASFVVPGGLAGGATAEKMTAVESNSGAPWEIAPTHLRFTFTDYALQGKFHEPRLFIYPAEEYAGSNPAAAEQIERLKKILAGGALLQETLPTIPFFNAAAQIAAGIQLLPFEDGRGVRFLTQYAQYAAPINNRELFYHFQGLSEDGRYYVIAVLPVSAPVLAEDEKPESPVPAGGIPIPGDTGPDEVYYFSVTEKLNSLAPDAYTPSLSLLDALIQSIQVTTP